MRVLVSAYGSGGCVEPVEGPTVRLRARGPEVRVCAQPDEEFAEWLARVGVPLVPLGQPVRPLVTGATAYLRRHAAELVAAVAEGCDPLAMRGVMPVGVWR